MRISDWSSDVCSSDLAVPVHRRRFRQAVGDVDAHAIAFDRLDRRARRAAVVTPAFRDAARCEFVLDLFGDQMEFLDAVAQAIRQRSAFTRSEERRVGKECDSTCRSRWAAYH